jgi:hypothetical protein
MPKIYRIFLCFLPILLSFSLIVQRGAASDQYEDTQQVISYLIDAVAESHLTFIRNGENHSSDEAAAHIRKKYEYFQSRIKSPEDFIRLCASKSLLSGKPYLVDTVQGRIPVEKWLEQILGEHIRNQNHS